MIKKCAYAVQRKEKQMRKKERRIRWRLIAVTAASAVLLSLFDPFAFTAGAAEGGSVRIATAEWQGEGTEESPWLIEDLEDLEALAESVNSQTDSNNYAGSYFTMTNDIDMSSKYSETTGTSWTAIGATTTTEDRKSFQGTFDGGGHAITGLYVKVADDGSEAYNNAALFGRIENSTIKNLSVAGYVESYAEAAGLAVWAENSTIQNCTNQCEVKSTDSGNNTTSYLIEIGGLVANVDGDTVIKECSNEGWIHGGYSAGGIFGSKRYSGEVKILDCRNEGTVRSSNFAGGIAGTQNGGTVSRCQNTGNVSSIRTAGGICGLFQAGLIELSWNEGKVEGTGTYSDGTMYAGGVCGQTSGTIRNCYNTGEGIWAGKSGSTSYAGGVCGYLYGEDARLESCFSSETGKNSDDFRKYILGGKDYGVTDDSVKNCPAEGNGNSSGEWTYVLQSGQQDLIWGQTLKGESKDKYPVLLTSVDLSEEEKAAKKVYRVQFYQEGEIKEPDYRNVSYVQYGNATGVTKCPNPYAHWSMKDGTEFTADTPLDGDLDVYLYYDGDDEAVKVIKKAIEAGLKDFQATNNTTSNEIQNIIEDVKNTYVVGLPEITKDVSKTKATKLEYGSITGQIIITRGDVTDTVDLNFPIERLPITDAEKVDYAKSVAESVLDETWPYRPSSTSYDETLGQEIKTALKNTAASDVTVTVKDIRIEEETAETPGTVTGTVSVSSGEEHADIPFTLEYEEMQEKYIAKLDELCETIHEALAGVKATRDLGRDDFDPLVQAAVRQVIPAPYFWADYDGMGKDNVDNPTRITISYSFYYGHNGPPLWTLRQEGEQFFFRHTFVISEPPETDEEKLAAALPVVQEVLDQIGVTNETDEESIVSAVKAALKDAGLDSVKAETDIFKTEATSDTPGNLSVEIKITCGEEVKTVSVDLPIEKLPKTDAEKVEEVKKAVEDVLENLVITNNTTKEDIQEAIDKALEDAGVREEMTAVVGGLARTEATEEAGGRLTGEVIIECDKNTEASDRVIIDVTIDKLPVTDEEKVQAAKKIAETAVKGMKVDNDTAKEDIQNAVDEALREAGISDVTATVGDLTIHKADRENEGSISGTITIVSADDGTKTDTAEINKTISKLPKTQEDLDAEKELAERVREIVKTVLAELTVSNDTEKGDIQEAIDKALADAGISGVTAEVGEITKTDATSKAEGSIRGTVTVTCGDAREIAPVNKTIEKLPKTEAELEEERQQAAAAIEIAKEALADKTFENSVTKQDIEEVIKAALEEKGISEDVTVTVKEEDFEKKMPDKEAGSVSGTIVITCGDAKEEAAFRNELPGTEEEQALIKAIPVLKKAWEELPVTKDSTKEEIEKQVLEAMRRALEEAGLNNVEVRGCRVDMYDDGTVGVKYVQIGIRDQYSSEILDEDDGFVRKNPAETDESKVKEARTAVENALKNLTVTNDTTKESIQEEINKALGYAGITGVTVTVGEISKTEATKDTEGSITGSIAITCGDAEVNVTINKRIEKLPKTDADKVEEAKTAVETALENLVITNGTTKESIQAAVEKALQEAGISDVTVTVGDIDKTEATEEAAGSIRGEITIVSNNDGTVSDSILVETVIDKLPSTDEEKVAAAKKIAEAVIKGLKGSNDTSPEGIKSAVDTILNEAGVHDVTVTVEDFSKNDATSDQEGSISGTVIITSTNDANLSDRVSIDKVIDKLPKTEEEIRQEEIKKVEEAKNAVEEAIGDLTVTNGTTKESIQEAVEKALEDAGISDVTVTVGDLVITEATEEAAGSIRGEITVVSNNDGSVSDSITIEIAIDRLPVSDEERKKAEEAKNAVEEALKDITPDNDITEENLLTVIQEAIDRTGITGVTVTVEDFQKTEATAENEGSITGNVVIRSGAAEETVVISVTIPRLSGKVDKEVTTDGKTSAQIATSEDNLKDILLEEAEKQQLANGTDIKIVLDVKDAGGSVSSGDKALVETEINGGSAAKGYTVGQYLDISLYKQIGENRTDITETKEQITITINVPESLRGTGRTFAVIRVHNGETVTLNDLDDDPNTVTVATDRFSTYVLVYHDAGSDSGSNGGSDGNGGSNGGNGSGSSGGSGNGGSSNNSNNNSNNNGTSGGNGTDPAQIKAVTGPKTDDRPLSGLLAALAMFAGGVYLLQKKRRKI